MADTEKFIDQLQTGPLEQLLEVLDLEPRRMNTFLSQPAPHGDEQWMPLHFAARAGAVAVINALLERGVHPDCRTRFRTPMHARQTPLHLAAAGGHAAAIQRLLEAEAEVEVRDALGRSPLWFAARHQHGEVVAQLVRRGADPEARDTQGRTPLHASLMVEPDPVATQATPLRPPTAHTSPAFDSAAALALLDANADPNAVCPKDPDGYTPLHRCVTLGEATRPVLKSLLDVGADTTVADPRFGRTAIAVAEHLERTELAALLRGD